MGRMFLTEDYEHIFRIYTEVKWWQEMRLNWNTKTRKEAERVLPSYLLAAYVKNLLEYWRLGEDAPLVTVSKRRSAPRTTNMIRSCLRTIESVIMSREFDDMECRAEIIQLYHDAGYQTAGQTRLEL